MKEFWSARARSLTPYVPGEQPQGQTFIKLNTNENPYPPSPAALAAIRAAADGALRLYPDPECGVLRQALAETYGLRPENVFARCWPCASRPFLTRGGRSSFPT